MLSSWMDQIETSFKKFFINFFSTTNEKSDQPSFVNTKIFIVDVQLYATLKLDLSDILMVSQCLLFIIMSQRNMLDGQNTIIFKYHKKSELLIE